ncbi:MAG: ADP-L-glycero-D-mannoheptose-6-epimerase [Methanoregula sp. PtaU1.Bin051]|nr:MAG: ADP-L-glycero-D-mannoheptose-6-epimerase [Methanoregula sp. PtaU1.Bin051]
MKKRILITGGAGFIGSHLARRCIADGHLVTVLDNLTTGFATNIPGGCNVINADIADPETLSLLPSEGFDVIMHLAAQSSGEVSQENPDLDLKVNTLATLMLLKWSMQNQVKRFLYASSMAVYGNPERLPVRETDPCLPLSFYGISKVASEHYIRHYASEGLDTTVFRMFSVYGPGQNMENLKQGMVSIFLAYLSKNEEILVKGDRNRFRDYIYIDDVVDAWCSSVDNPASFKKTYNLATGKKTCVHELVDAEIRLFGRDRDTYPVRYHGSTPSDQFGLYADISAIRRDLDWSPKIDLEEGLKRMIAWVKEGHRQS